jgi:hypothetical protein
MDSIMFHPGPSRPCGHPPPPPLKWPYSHFRGGPPAGQAAVFYPFGHPMPYAHGAWQYDLKSALLPEKLHHINKKSFRFVIIFVYSSFMVLFFSLSLIFFQPFSYFASEKHV